MNAREKTLLTVLAAVVGLGVVSIGGWMWFVVPLKDYNARIRTMTAENKVKKAEIDQFMAEKKKLVLAKLKSLPANQNEASTEYINYLHPLFIESGLNPEEITPSNPVDVKPVSNIAGVKRVGHQVMTFQVRARGTLAQMVAAMERMRRTPYEHRIKNLTIDRADNAPKDPNAKLIINMLIETLLVAKTESKPGVPPGIDVKYVLFDSLAARMDGPIGLGQAVATIMSMQSAPPENERRYADIAKRNIFVGAILQPPPQEVKAPVEPLPPPPPSPGPIPAFIRLTQIEPKEGEAHYLNLFYKKDERKISAKENSGYNTFLIAADDLSYTFFLGKVLRVDSRDVFFQVKDKVYQWHVGDTLETATRAALSLDYMDAIDLEPDYEWGKKELEKEKGKERSTKKKGVKGR